MNNRRRCRDSMDWRDILAHKRGRWIMLNNKMVHLFDVKKDLKEYLIAYEAEQPMLDSEKH